MQKLPVVFVWTGFFCLILSIIVGWLFGPWLIDDQVARYAQLRNNTFIWDKWKDPTNEMFLRVYFFNVTNPGEVEDGGVPVFQEIGPYTYKETRVKENIVYNEETDTLSYFQPITYYFQPELSSGLESDLVTVINIPLVGVSDKLSSYSAFVRYMVGTFLSQYEESTFLQISVQELLFKGYYNEMTDELQHLTGENFFPGGMVGVLVGRNGSNDGLYEVHAGIKDSSKLGQIYKYNGHTHLPVWEGAPCNLINGTDGSVLPPFLTRESVILGFSHDVCRSFYVTYVRDVEVRGVKGYRFEPPEEQFQSPRRNRKNACFCGLEEEDDDEDFLECFEDGVHSGKGCHRDGPVTISNPHFLYAPSYLNLTKGLSPDKEKHGIFVEFEPTTGLILRASRRMQVNADLKPNRAVPGMRNVPTMQFPVLWVEETFYLDKEVQSNLLFYLLLAQSCLEIGKWVCLFTSLGLLFGAILINIARARSKPHIYNN